MTRLEPNGVTLGNRFKGAVFLAVGVGLLVAAVWSVTATRDYLRRTRLAPGLVIAEPFGPHHVTVRFRTSTGRVVTYPQNGEVTLHRGERVAVRYDPADPVMSACVDQWAAIWGDTGFFGGMGSIFTLIGLFLLLSGRNIAWPRRG